MGVELFVVDDGWFGGRTSDERGLGDWWPNPGRFPDGLDPMIKAVGDLGMAFGIWVEPEMVNPDSDLYRAHPDWVHHLPHRERTTQRNQLVLDFSRDDVAAWAHGWLDALAAKVAFLKWDFNRPITQAADEAWIPHVRNVYAILDRLRADHPHLRIEACAGGGGRADLGILARTDQVWTSDNTDAAERIAIQHGFGQIYPARAMGAWVTDSPNAISARPAPLRLRFHVAMAGHLGIGGNLMAWSDDDLAAGAELVALYKDIRPVVHDGDQYRLGTRGVQYIHGERVVVLRWQPSGLDRSAVPLRLAGLEPGARYRDVDSGRTHHGAVLMAHGLPLPMWPFDGVSDLVRLIREDSREHTRLNRQGPGRLDRPAVDGPARAGDGLVHAHPDRAARAHGRRRP